MDHQGPPGRQEEELSGPDGQAPAHPLLAREGWWFLALTLLAAAGTWAAAGWLWSLPFWVAFLFCAQFFRDPPRRRPAGGGDIVVSPADGRVVQVGRVPNPHGEGHALKLSVFMNVFNVHSNRIPCDGEVVETAHHSGRFVNAALDKASEDNERQVTRLRSGTREIVLVQVAGLIARRIACYLKAGQQVRAADRFGFIRFGSRVDLFLPEGSVAKAAIGDRVRAGTDVVATLPADSDG